MSSLKLLVTGCKGRMGQAVLAAAQAQSVDVGAAIDLGDLSRSSQSPTA